MINRDLLRRLRAWDGTPFDEDARAAAVHMEGLTKLVDAQRWMVDVCLRGEAAAVARAEMALEEIGQLQARVEDQAHEIADLTRQLQGQPRRPQDVAALK
jgi:hypothetical protein